MAVATQKPSEKASALKRSGTRGLVRVSRYVFMRVVVLFATVVIGVYLTIMIANMGGYVDQIMRSEIRDRITQSIGLNPAMQQMDPAVRRTLIEETIAQE